ncbi:MAG: peptidase M20 [Burkholderiales bacterium RIFCSPHIGHO2_01_FULL_64_960]|nr:MAG: peptidase M20 [Burkholderiales bacterium RIFCSPHIGHO2_01_FULL_64_960]
MHAPLNTRQPTLWRTICLGAALYLLGSPVHLFAQTAASTDNVVTLLNSHYPSLELLYKDLHENPELGFNEVRTASKLAAEMRRAGFEVTEKVGRTGLVALYRNGAGPTVMVRTDMDALPMEEKTGLPYASKVKAEWTGKQTNVAHSCGHDVHMAAWVGAARILVDLKDQWKGTLMFVAQPAEELGAGARAMVDDGLFKRFPKPDMAFALHVSGAPAGQIGYRAGPITSSSDSFEITFKGVGGHGSAPHRTIDPIVMGSRFVNDVQTVISREKEPAEFGVVTVGAFESGSAGNIIPDRAILRGTIRSYQPAVRERLLSGVRRTALAAATSSAAPEPVIDMGTGTASVINSEPMVHSAVAALRSAFGDNRVVQIPAIGASEDFSEFSGAGIPSMYFFVGGLDPQAIAAASKPGGRGAIGNHSPYFAPLPEPSIKSAVQAMSVVVMNAMPLAQR